MSIKLMSMVWESSLPANEKFVLLALADHGRDDGSRIYPSIATVAKKTGFSERTVQRQMRKLQTLGVLAIVKKTNRYGTTEYLIRIDKLTVLSQSRGDNLSPLKKVRGDNHDTSGVTTATLRGDIHDISGVTDCHPNYILEPSLETTTKKQPADFWWLKFSNACQKLKENPELFARTKKIFMNLNPWEQKDQVTQMRSCSDPLLQEQGLDTLFRVEEIILARAVSVT